MNESIDCTLSYNLGYNVLKSLKTEVEPEFNSNSLTKDSCSGREIDQVFIKSEIDDFEELEDHSNADHLRVIKEEYVTSVIKEEVCMLENIKTESVEKESDDDGDINIDYAEEDSVAPSFFKIYSCKSCNHKLRNKAHLMTQKIKHCSVDKKNNDNNTPAIDNESKHLKPEDNNKTRLPCMFCEYGSKDKYALNRHVKRMHSETDKIYSCKMCQLNFKTKFNMQRHFKVKHDDACKVYNCEHCNYSTKCKAHMKRHYMLRHDDNTEMLSCTFCNYNSKNRQNLKEHVERKHEVNNQVLSKVFVCEICGLYFNGRHVFRDHYRMKHDETIKMLCCEQCNYRTKKKSNMTKHFKRKHDNDCERAQCTFCNYNAKLKYDLKEHIKNNHVANNQIQNWEICGSSIKKLSGGRQVNVKQT